MPQDLEPEAFACSRCRVSFPDSVKGDGRGGTLSMCGLCGICPDVVCHHVPNEAGMLHGYCHNCDILLFPISDHFVIFAAEPCVVLIGICNSAGCVPCLSGIQFLGLMVDLPLADSLGRLDQQQAGELTAIDILRCFVLSPLESLPGARPRKAA